MQGLEGAALRPDRLPGPRGFNLLNQLMLDSVRGRSQELKDERGSSSKKKNRKKKTEKKSWSFEATEGKKKLRGKKRKRCGREEVEEDEEGEEGEEGEQGEGKVYPNREKEGKEVS